MKTSLKQQRIHSMDTALVSVQYGLFAELKRFTKNVRELKSVVFVRFSFPFVFVRQSNSESLDFINVKMRSPTFLVSTQTLESSKLYSKNKTLSLVLVENWRNDSNELFSSVCFSFYSFSGWIESCVDHRWNPSLQSQTSTIQTQRHGRSRSQVEGIVFWQDRKPYSIDCNWWRFFNGRNHRASAGNSSFSWSIRRFSICWWMSCNRVRHFDIYQNVFAFINVWIDFSGQRVAELRNIFLWPDKLILSIQRLAKH